MLNFNHNHDINKKHTSLIFLHIPKTAGSTLHRVIERQYNEKDCFNINYRNTLASKIELRNFPELKKNKITLLKGHMGFGWHKLLPQPCNYVTILRDPVDRVLSLYYFILSDSHHYLYNTVTDRQMSLRECLETRISAELENGQTRLLSGKEEVQQRAFTNFKESSSDWLLQAKNHLKEYFVTFGITEKFDESLILFWEELSWYFPPFYVKHNVNKNRPDRTNISKQDLYFIEKYNELDLELYEYAKKIFENRIKDQGIKVNTFKKVNKIYNIYVNKRKFLS